MKRFPLFIAAALLLSVSMWAQSQQANPTAYTFQDVNYPGDTFTQLLGINNAGVIAGYHNFNSNSGFTLTLPNHFTTENFPNSAMTQVIGINNQNTTVGFYVDQSGRTHGFEKPWSGSYRTVDYPGAVFNQLLGQNDNGQAAGYYSRSFNNTTPDFPYVFDEGALPVFEVLTIPGAVGGAQDTGVNNLGQRCGFYIDANGANHGYLANFGTVIPLDYPGSTGTQALGLNNVGEVVGFYTDAAGNTHGFIYKISAQSIGAHWQSIDDPNGIGTTVVNGINDSHQLVGFWGVAPTNTGFVATPE